MGRQRKFLVGFLRMPLTIREGLGLASFGSLSVALGYFAVLEPLPALLCVFAVLLVIACLLKPVVVASTIAFLTTAIPKSGIKVGTFPFPVFIFGIFLAVALLAVSCGVTKPTPRATIGVIAFFAYIGLRSVFIAESEDLGYVAAFVAWSALPVLLLLAAVSLRAMPRLFLKAAEWGFVVSAAYAVIQMVGGIDATAIPGITYAFGDNLAAKNNVIFAVDPSENISKIPSTYQNGNIYGVVAAMFLVLALYRIVSKIASRTDLVLLAASLFALFVSGSRTGIVAAGVGILVVYMNRGTLSVKIRTAVVVVVGAALVLVLQPGLIARYSVGGLLQSGGSGRSAYWSHLLALLNVTQWSFGTEGVLLGEGWAGILMQLGLVGTCLLICVAVLLTRGNRQWYAILVPIVVAMCFDSSYAYFPTLFVPALFAAASDPKMVRVALRHLRGHASIGTTSNAR